MAKTRMFSRSMAVTAATMLGLSVLSGTGLRASETNPQPFDTPASTETGALGGKCYLGLFPPVPSFGLFTLKFLPDDRSGAPTVWNPAPGWIHRSPGSLRAGRRPAAI